MRAQLDLWRPPPRPLTPEQQEAADRVLRIPQRQEPRP